MWISAFICIVSSHAQADALLIILNRIGFPVDDDQTILLFGACLEEGKVNFDHFLKIIDYRSGKLDKLESTLTDDCLLKLSKESAFTTKYDVHDGTFNSVPVKVYILSFLVSFIFQF